MKSAADPCHRASEQPFSQMSLEPSCLLVKGPLLFAEQMPETMVLSDMVRRPLLESSLEKDEVTGT